MPEAKQRKGLYAVLAAVTVLGGWYMLHAFRASAADALPGLLLLAPKESSFIGYADLETLRESPLAQQFTAMAPPATVDPDYADFVNGTGFDYQRDLDHVLVAAGEAPGQTLMFAEGRFNREKIEQYVLRSGKFAEENGHPVYVVPSATPGKNIQFAFLAADRIAFANGGDLSAVLSASAAAELDPAMRERISRVAGAPLFAAIKGSALNGSLGMAGAGGAGLSALFAPVRWVSLAARPDGETVLLSAEGECDRAEEAQKVASALDLLRNIFRGAMADPKARGQMPAESAAATSKLLEGMKITTESTRVRLLVSLTPDMLRLPAAPPAAGQ